MELLLCSSIIIKGVAAIVEILTQLYLTRMYGVDNYGSYTYFVSIVEMTYWLLFSGIIKCNTFYLSDKSCSIFQAKRKYIKIFFIPIVTLLFITSFLFHNINYVICCIALIGYFFAFDASSTALARGKGYKFLFGEWLVGRIFLLATFVLTGIISSEFNLLILLILYSLQYVAMVLFFRSMLRNENQKGNGEIPISWGKLSQYQMSDVTNAIITQSPIVIQYLFVGTFETGFIGIVFIAQKLINFVSGPTSKIFLPIFSQLYKSGNKKEIAQYYNLIIRIQTLYVSVIGVALLGYPDFILSIFNKSLLPFTHIF